MKNISRISAIMVTSIVGIILGSLRPIVNQATTYATNTTTTSPTKTMIGKSYVNKRIKDNDPAMKIIKYGEKNGYSVYTVGTSTCTKYLADVMGNDCHNFIVTKNGIIQSFDNENKQGDKWLGIGEFYRFTDKGVLFYMVNANRHDPSCEASLVYYFTYYNFEYKKTLSSVLTERYRGLKPDKQNYCYGDLHDTKTWKLTNSVLNFYKAKGSDGTLGEQFDIKAKSTEEGFYQIINNKGKLYSLFSDDNIGFSFKYPNNGKITIDSRSDPKRIQNFSYPDDRNELSAGDFIIEVSYRDNNRLCTDEMGSITSRYTVNGTKVVRGDGIAGGDAGGKIYALCFNKVSHGAELRGIHHGSSSHGID